MAKEETAWSVKLRNYPDGRGGYARASQDRKNKRQSVGAQFDDIEIIFDDNEWPVNEELMFSDNNLSASEYATIKERPGFTEVCDAIQEGRLWLLVVTEVSRITRVVQVGLDFVKIAQEAGGIIVMTTDGKTFDLKTNTGVHDFIEAVVKASRESATTSDRIKRNKRTIGKQGRYHGGRPRWGRVRAIKDEEGRVINTGKVGHDIVEEEAEIANEVVDRINAFEPMSSITRDLKGRGIVGVSGNPMKRQVLEKAITSPHMVGIQVSNGREYPGSFPPIIRDREKWERAKSILASQKAARKRKGQPRSYLLNGECGRCGSVVNGHYRDKARRYRCRSHDDVGIKVGCGLQRLAEPVELLVLDAVRYRYNSPGFIEALQRAYETNAEHSELSQLIRRAQKLRSELDELEDAWSEGTEGLDLKTMLRMKAAKEKQLKTVSAQMERSAAGQMAAAISKGSIDEAFEKADMDQLRVYVDLVVEKVRFMPTKPNGKRNTWKHEATGKSWLFEPKDIQIIFKF